MNTATDAKPIPAPLTDREVSDAADYLRERAAGFSRRIAPVYQLLGWSWGDGERAYVPQAHHIEATLHELIADLKPWACSPHIARVETGGLFAEVERERYDGGSSSLRVALGFTDSDPVVG
jgi:hypothetical protein